MMPFSYPVKSLSLCLGNFKGTGRRAELLKKYSIKKDSGDSLLSYIRPLLAAYALENKEERIPLFLGLGKPDFSFLPEKPAGASGGEWFAGFTHLSLIEEIKKEFPQFEFVNAFSSSCVTGLYALKLAMSYLNEYGRCIVISGENSGFPLPEAGYRNMGVLSKKKIMRPFDSSRDGFTVGSGAGMIALEKDGKDTGFGKIKALVLRNDASDTVHYRNNGANIAEAIREALCLAELCPGSIEYINLHGTATKYNDLLETTVLKNVFGHHLDDIRLSAVKPFTGHCLSASGLIETIISFISLKEGYIFPTMNNISRDEECGLNYTFNRGINKDIRNFLKISLGFGGNIGILVGGK